MIGKLGSNELEADHFLKGLGIKESGLREIEQARSMLFRGSVKGKEWDSLKKVNNEHNFNIREHMEREEESFSGDEE